MLFGLLYIIVFLHFAITLLYRLTAVLFSSPSRCFRSFAFPGGLQPPAFSPLLPIVAIYYAFVSQRGVWSPRGHSVLVPYDSLFIISRLRGYIAQYICTERTCTRLYI